MTYFNAQGQGRVGWRSLVVTQVVNAVDADAQSFISAAGITNLTQASAVNTLVNDLKTYGLWTKMKALYPMVGGTATTHKFNLKDPRDLDAAFRLVFNGGWVHSSTGAKPNGTTGYADTKLVPSTNYPTVSDVSIGFYSRTNIFQASSDISSYQNSSQALGIQTRWTDNKIYSQFYRDAQPYNIVATNTDSSGLFILSRTSNSLLKQFRNATILGTSTFAIAGSITTIPICLSNNGANGAYSSREQAFAFIGNGLTDTEATNLYNSVQKFQTTLGRQIGSPIVSDTDAQAFINAAGLTDLGQANAVNTLVVDLKAAGLWTKMKALYPMVGGTATTHKFNLKDPRDLDAAFRLVFTGGWTHTSTGALPNGTTAYADTFLAPQATLSQNSTHISYYSRTNNDVGIEMGARYPNTNPSMLYLAAKYSSVNFSRLNNIGTQGNVANTDGRGYYLISRTTSSEYASFKNTTKTTISQSSQSIPAQSITLGAYYENLWYYGSKESAFASIGDGLTDTEATNFYNSVQKFQTTLGRQV